MSASSSLRQVLAHNGSLWLRPFAPHEYEPEVHEAAYTCVAESPSGRAVSNAARVRAGEMMYCNISIWSV